MAIKTPSILPELQAFVANLSASVPYEGLLAAAADAGWNYRMTQREVLFTPDDGVMVTFDVQVGRDGSYEPFDAVTVRLPSGPGPVSMVARVQLQQTLIYLFFGRLPPAATAAAAPPVQRTVDVSQNRGDIVLSDEDGGEYVPDATEDAGLDRLDLVVRLEPDGVPIFRDLYAMGGDSGEIIDALLKQIGEFLVGATAPEQVLAVYTKNDEAMQFLKDLGDDQDRADLKALLDKHKNRLMTAAAPPKMVNIPRRRARAH